MSGNRLLLKRAASLNLNSRTRFGYARRLKIRAAVPFPAAFTCKLRLTSDGLLEMGLLPLKDLSAASACGTRLIVVYLLNPKKHTPTQGLTLSPKL